MTSGKKTDVLIAAWRHMEPLVAENRTSFLFQL